MHKFQKYGEIIKRVSGSNWMDIYYAEPVRYGTWSGIVLMSLCASDEADAASQIQAERAITQNAAMVDGLLIGVVPVSSLSRNCELGL